MSRIKKGLGMQMFMKCLINTTRNACKIGDELHRRSEARNFVGLLLSNGVVSDPMIDRFLELEPLEIRGTTEFDLIIEEIEKTYVLGAFFSTVSASMVTIERMLNMARIELHKLVQPGMRIRRLWAKKATNDWRQNIDALNQWKYLNMHSIPPPLSLNTDGGNPISSRSKLYAALAVRKESSFADVMSPECR